MTAALLMTSVTANSLLAEKRLRDSRRGDESGYLADTYARDYSSHPYATEDEVYDILGIKPVDKTTMGQPVLTGDYVPSMNPAVSGWAAFRKKWIPNFGYKGRRRM